MDREQVLEADKLLSYLSTQTSYRRKYKMATSNFDPGGVGRPPPPSYASRVTGKYQKLDRNVLEIVIIKKVENNMIHFDGDEVERVCE